MNGQLPILLGPIAGVLGGLLGALPYRASPVFRRVGVICGALVSIFWTNMHLDSGVSSLFGNNLLAGSVVDLLIAPMILAIAVSISICFALSIFQTTLTPTKNFSRARLQQNQQNIGDDLAETYSVFISYRRADSLDVTSRIYDRFVNLLGKERVYRDIDSIPLGGDFRAAITAAIKKCSACIVIIGPNWRGPKPEGEAFRIFDSDDPVRQEVEVAFSSNVRVLPLLIVGAEMPREGTLPPTITQLRACNAFKVRSDPDFHTDLDRVITELLSGAP